MLHSSSSAVGATASSVPVRSVIPEDDLASGDINVEVMRL